MFVSLRLLSTLPLTMLLMAAFCWFFVPAHAFAEARVALVVGNGAYVNVASLANPLGDAKAMAASLRRLNFEVVEGYDLNVVEMTRIVHEFARRMEGAKVGLIFYAGHGIAVGDENYLLPVDVDLKSESDLDFRAVNLDFVIRQMQREERVNIVVLDACRDNPFASRFSTRTRSISRGLVPVEPRGASGTLIAFATDPRAVAFDGEGGGNSPFTAALLRHMETPEISITTVMDRVRADVWEATGKRQKPWTNSSIIGEFRLNPAPLTGAGSALATASTAAPADAAAAGAMGRLARLDGRLPSQPPSAVDSLGAGDALGRETGSRETEAAMKLGPSDYRELHARLRASGFGSGRPSGWFGAREREAVRQWQLSRKIPATGFFTDAQVKALVGQSESAYRRSLDAQPPVTPARKPRNARPVEEPPRPVLQRRPAAAPAQAEPGGARAAAPAATFIDPVLRGRDRSWPDLGRYPKPAEGR